MVTLTDKGHCFLFENEYIIFRYVWQKQKNPRLSMDLILCPFRGEQGTSAWTMPPEQKWPHAMDYIGPSFMMLQLKIDDDSASVKHVGCAERIYLRGGQKNVYLLIFILRF